MELATIARPYAHALFHAVAKVAHGDSTAWLHWLQQLAQIASHPDMSFLISHPKIKRAQISEFLLSVIPFPNTSNNTSNANNELAKNFVAILVKNRRLSAVPEIARQFNALKNAYENVADATITSAFPLDQPVLAELITKLKHWFGQTLKPQVSIDPSLIGGVRVAVGDQVFDTSVRTQLTQLQTALITY